MKNKVTLKFNPTTLEKTWESSCRDVLNLFCLPDRRILCGFDSKGELSFEHLGYGNARAFHTPTNGFNSWPVFLENVRCDDEGPVDSLIYVRLVPPTDDALIFAVTFAHELQHFVQAWQSPKFYAASGFLSENLPSFDLGANAFETWRVPIERDAMIRSKQVAEAKFGRAFVAARVHSLIADGTSLLEVEEWKYFESLSPESVCDWQNETRHLIEENLQAVMTLRPKWPSEIDFSKKEWFLD
ncbi:MAG TPA: hypothetical protein VGR72_08075 [Candidatus Acidoferrales bacterium]|nr:hypothetical protein [Candidatus Acidoferrales bacterium]